MSAVVTIPVNPTIAQRLAGLDQGQRLRLALGVVLFVAIGVVGLVMGRQAEWRVLYSNLADKDGGAVITQLTTLNVPYKYTEGHIGPCRPGARCPAEVGFAGIAQGLGQRVRDDGGQPFWHDPVPGASDVPTWLGR